MAMRPGAPSPFVLLALAAALLAATMATNAVYSPTPVDLLDLGRTLARIGEITGMSGPYFWLAVGSILALERMIPARPTQPALPFAMAYDVFWLLVDVVVRSGLLLAFAALLDRVYSAYLSGLTISSLTTLPYALRVVLALLLADFLGWFHHLARHKVRWLWHFHALHHSQREMTLFTDLRYHPLEYVITAVIVFVPLRVLDFGVGEIAAYVIARTWYTRLYHSNVALDLGVLRYVFVTPHSHRTHHSADAEDHDSNYGVVFSIWDRLFGTSRDIPGYYPATGLTDDEIPIEQHARGLRRVTVPIEQLLHPFRRIAADLSEGVRARQSRNARHGRPG